MLLWRAMCFILIKQVAMAPVTPTPGSDRRDPGVHTINNENPYRGVTVTEGHGKYPVIFEPLQNVQTSRSTYKVTSFINFTPYLEYFQKFERYLEAFKISMKTFGDDPIMWVFQEKTAVATSSRYGEACRHYPACYMQPLLYILHSEHTQAAAYRQQQERCMAHHMQACLVLKQFEYMLNVTKHVNENYLRAKEKFLRAIDYVENINVGQETSTDPPTRQKCASTGSFETDVNHQEIEYLIQLLVKLAEWNPINGTVHREKRFIPLFASIGAAIGSIVNAGQISKIKENIAILQDATILQDQVIPGLGSLHKYTPATSGSAAVPEKIEYTPIPLEGNMMVPASLFPGKQVQKDGTATRPIYLGTDEDSGISSISRSTPARTPVKGFSGHCHPFASTNKSKPKLLAAAQQHRSELAAKQQGAPHGAHIQPTVHQSAQIQPLGSEPYSWEQATDPGHPGDSIFISVEEHSLYTTAALLERDAPSRMDPDEELVSVHD